jgi:hypothetical protein
MKHRLYSYLLLLFSCSLFLLAACSEGDDEEMPAPNPPSGCVTENITYTSHIKALVEKNCALSGCHVPGTGRLDYTSFAGLKTVADDGRLRQKALVERSMPPNGSLTECELAQLDAWLKDGAPEN